ncbi:MAG: outer membrane beta-barrel protein [Chitinophagales bacterium]
MRKRLLLFLIFAGASSSIYAQSRVHGKIADTTGKPISNANVLLVNYKDSVLVKGTLTTEGGVYSFENINTGKYLVTATYTGVTPAYSQPFEIDDKPGSIDIGIIQLDRSDVVLSTVTVTAKKPLYEQKIDRLVINVAAAITYSGISALDVLERSPGIIVNRINNSISINGKSGTIIMINGKRNYMDMSGLIQMLSSLPSGSVERIEVITTPPANFDAEGNAGIINIVLKSNDQYGTNGSYTLTAGYSKGEQTSGSININHRKGKLNLFGNYFFARGHGQQVWTTYHAVTNGGKLSESYSADHRHFYQFMNGGQAGIDYEINKKTILGALVSANYRQWTMTSANDATVTTNQKLDTITGIINKELHTNLNFGANLNFQHTFKPEEKITFNADYLWYKDKNPNSYLNSYHDGNMNFLYDESVRSDKLTPLEIWVGALDYSKKISRKTDMEAGLKTTLSKFTNTVQVNTLMQNNWILDSTLSGTHSLDENISAAYTSFSVKFSEKNSIKLGLRYEYTHSKLTSGTDNNIIDRNYGNLFPSFFYLHTISESSSLNFTYSRRIWRPSFDNLAPWVLFLDPKTFETGNPGLQPAITDALNVSYTLKNKIVSLSYSYTAHPIILQPEIDAATNKEVRSIQNGLNSQNVSISFALPFTISKWWNMQNNLQVSWGQDNAFYKTPVRTENKNYYITSTQNFLLPKDLSISLSGYYVSKTIWGLFTNEPYGGVDMGIQKKWTNKKSSLSFNINDIFNSSGISRNAAIFPAQNLFVKTDNIYGYRGFSLSFTHNFGNAKVKEKRDRSTGAEDEKNRAY